MRRSFLLLVSLCSYSYSINPIALVLTLRVGQDFLIGRIWWFRPQHDATLRLEEKNVLPHCCNLVDVVSIIFGKASTLGTLPTSFPPHVAFIAWLPCGFPNSKATSTRPRRSRTLRHDFQPDLQEPPKRFIHARAPWTPWTRPWEVWGNTIPAPILDLIGNTNCLG